MAVKEKEPVSTLASWGEIVRRQGEAARKRDDEDLAKMKRDYPKQVKRVKGLESPDLLEHFQVYSQRSFADPRQTKVFQDLAVVAKKELLRRLKG